jgi:hypothetical protein
MHGGGRGSRGGSRKWCRVGRFLYGEVQGRLDFVWEIQGRLVAARCGGGGRPPTRPGAAPLHCCIAAQRRTGRCTRVHSVCLVSREAAGAFPPACTHVHSPVRACGVVRRVHALYFGCRGRVQRCGSVVRCAVRRRAAHFFWLSRAGGGACVRALVSAAAGGRGWVVGWVARNRKFSSSRRIFLDVLVDRLYGSESIFLFSHTNEFCGK